MSPFVAPYRFDNSKRKELLKTLKQRDIGDDPSRNLFIAALEYEIGAFRRATLDAEPNSTPEGPSAAPLPETQPASEELARLHAAVQNLIQALQQASGPSGKALLDELGRNDAFRRRYEPEYLKALDAELTKLLSVCEPLAALPALPSEDHAKTARVLETSRRLAAMLAHTYSECFEAQPTASEEGPFHHVVNAIIALTGIEARADSEILRSALER